jgi:hypothetical protein
MTATAARQMFDLYRVRGHAKNSRPDGREKILTGNLDDVWAYYCGLDMAQRCEDSYLVADAGADPYTAIYAIAWYSDRQ